MVLSGSEIEPSELSRRRDQAARALTLKLTFAVNSSWEKTRRLTEPSAHDDDLRLLACRSGVRMGSMLRPMGGKPALQR